MSRKFFEIGGVVAAIVLIAFGVAAIVMGMHGRSTVKDNLSAQQIVGTPDMTPAGITAAVKKAGLNVASLPIPTCSVANQPINNGASARCFAQYMNIHALEATGGVVYSAMPQFASANGKGTSDPTLALKANGKPVANPARNIWFEETSLTTALNAAYMADQISLFGVVVGIALLLTGFGFAILAVGGALRSRESLAGTVSRRAGDGAVPVPAAGD